MSELHLAGLGTRGSLAVNRFLNIEGAQIAIICDIKKENLQQAQRQLKKNITKIRSPNTL